MKNINNLEPKQAIIFNNGEEILTLIENESKVKVILDESEYVNDNILTGVITFLAEDAIDIDNKYGVILFEYIKEITLV